MKAITDSTWHWINFDTGEIWKMEKHQYIKLIEVLLTKKQFEKDFSHDGIYIISNRRYEKAWKLYKSLKQITI